MFARSGNPMLLVDDARIYREANPAACRLLRCERDDIVGHALAEFTPSGHVDDIEDMWTELLARGHTVRGSWICDREGHELAVNVAVAAGVPEAGRHLEVLLSAVDNGPATTHEVRLSPREREITHLLAQGQTGEQIAQELFLSPETVRTHIRNAMEHAGAHTRAHLVALALREGLIDD